MDEILIIDNEFNDKTKDKVLKFPENKVKYLYFPLDGVQLDAYNYGFKFKKKTNYTGFFNAD